MPFRHSLIIQVTTEPKDKSAARAHTGGWSEQIWSNATIDWKARSQSALLRARAVFLPTQCAIVGVRTGSFTIVGNRLVPGGTSLVKINFPGSPSYNVDVPQACMHFSGQADSLVNKVRYTARGFPDEGIQQGEFTGESTLKRQLETFAGLLVTQNWKTVVRDLTQPAFGIQSISNAGLLTSIGPPGWAVDDFIRLVRVKDTNGDAVSGKFRISGTTGILQFQLAKWGGETVDNSGHARKDLLSLVAYNSLDIDRVGTKKIGNPSERYRGRQSKRAA